MNKFSQPVTVIKKPLKVEKPQYIFDDINRLEQLQTKYYDYTTTNKIDYKALLEDIEFLRIRLQRLAIPYMKQLIEYINYLENIKKNY